MASRSLGKIKAAKLELEAAGIKGTVSAIQLDVIDEKSIKEAAVYVQRQFGWLDVLINNTASGSLNSNVKARFQSTMETNVIGPAMVSAAFRPLLLKSNSIYVSSGAGTIIQNSAANPHLPRHVGIKNGDAYIASKAALNMLAVLDPGKFGPRDSKVFAMSPGFVRSNLRGSSEGAWSGWSRAGDPEVSGELIPYDLKSLPRQWTQDS